MGPLEVSEMLEKSIIYEHHMYRMYQKFAEVAENEGFINIARLFRALSEAKKIHLKFFFKALNKRDINESDYSKIAKEDFPVGNTKENLEYALKLEKHNERISYGNSMQISLNNANPLSFMLFNQAKLSEESHKEALKKALSAIDSGNDLELSQGIFICPTCGYLSLNRAPAHCPVCNEPGNSFIKF